MRLVTYRTNNAQSVGLLCKKGVVLAMDVPYWPDNLRSMLAIIRAGEQGRRELEQLVDRAMAEGLAKPLHDQALLAPIPVPARNVMCLGFNYAEHAQESLAAHQREIKYPEHPIVFTKSVTSINGPGADVPLHEQVTSELDWEVELAVVIGRQGRAISAADALQHVFAYTIVNDISARDLQFRHKQYFLGKSLDGTCPMGPWLVTADEIDDPQNLALQCRVNGEVKQRGNTSQMIFSIARIIEILSRGMTLQPGDIIATGTPSGVGFARTPPEFLQSGDIVECEIENIGILRNQIRGIRGQTP